MHLIIPNEPNQMMMSNTTANFHFLRAALGGQTQILQRETSHWLAQAPGVPPTSFSLGPPRVGHRPHPSCLRVLLCQALILVPAGSSHVLVHLPLALPGTPFSFGLLEEFHVLLKTQLWCSLKRSLNSPERLHTPGLAHREWAGGCEGVFWA